MSRWSEVLLEKQPHVLLIRDSTTQLDALSFFLLDQRYRFEMRIGAGNGVWRLYGTRTAQEQAQDLCFTGREIVGAGTNLIFASHENGHGFKVPT